ncbi:MAG TPA: glycosyltransferase [Candidatus Paceibacterota bacterium]|nr:glycosyltransferase [Candidatus Paceibacterota bacterium]
MKLLILTQIVDQNDHSLGFFHSWIEELSTYFEKITVICLKEGAHSLPQHVSVVSLGKERGTSRPVRLWLLLRYSLAHRNEYDSVFVHMNQEYILAAGLLWKFLGKPIYMWRNHYAGSILTDIAATFCKNVFCTSKFSYTAKYRKTILMPIGVNLALYHNTGVRRIPRSVLFYARLSPSKRPHVLIEALVMLKKKGVVYTADIYGTALPKDEEYLMRLKRRVTESGLDGQIKFYPGTPPAEGPAIFSAHEIFVNLGESGMYDKTLFEAAACGSLVIAASKDWASLVHGRVVESEESLAQVIEETLSFSQEEQEAARATFRRAVEEHSLSVLGERLAKTMLAN